MNRLSQLIAWRFLFSSRQRFVPFLALVAFTGIALGVWSLTVVLSIMNGFQKELSNRLIGLNTHLTIENVKPGSFEYHSLLEQLSNWPEILEVEAMVEGEGIAQVSSQDFEEAFAVKIRGVEKLSPHFLERLPIYPKEVSEWELLAGQELAAGLGIRPDSGETLNLIYPFGEIGPTGDFVPKRETFLLTHVFRTGLYEWDAFRVVVPLGKAISLLGDLAQTSLAVRLKNFSDLKRVERKLKGLPIKSFATQNKRLFAALQLERMVMIAFLVLFGLIASFSVLGLILLFVDAKRRDLAILRCLGVSQKGAANIFLTLGGFLGGLGSVVGAALGGVSCFLLQKFPIKLPSAYYLDLLPVEIRFSWFALAFGIGFLLVLFSSLYPVGVARKLDPLVCLREE